MIDTFTCNWNLFLCSYIFCPFSLIHRAVRKIIEESVEAICIIPDWPTAMWYPLITKICIKPPLVLPHRKTTLMLPHKPDQVHPLFPKFDYLHVTYQGNVFIARVFRKINSNSCEFLETINETTIFFPHDKMVRILKSKIHSIGTR